MTDHAGYDAIDLFAGPGGWDIGAESLGLRVLGIEFDEFTCATRHAAGLPTVRGDVRSYGPFDFPAKGLIASPPCQTFSAAGKGAGRKALDDVLSGVRTLAARQPLTGEFEDERTGLVLEPLRWALEACDGDEPYEWLAFEQVPTVLPVWEAMANVLRGEGYSVTTGYLTAEMYGVPQTRKRAILVAARGWSATFPPPTHSRYYSRTPAKLDPGVLPWVSMAEALGWGMTARPSITVVTGANGGGSDPMSSGSGGRAAIQRERDAGRWLVGFPRRADTPSNLAGDHIVEIDGTEYRARDLRPADQPAQVVTQKARSWNRYLVQSARSKATVRDETEPAPTITGGHDHGERRWEFYDGRMPGSVPREISKPAPTLLASGLAKGTGVWTDEPDHSVPYDNYRPTKGVRVSISEAAALQTFPPDYPWQGSRSKQFQQIGNAVPPVLARAVLAELVGRPFAPSRAA